MTTTEKTTTHTTLRRASATTVQAIAGAVLIAVHLPLTKPLRRWRTRWGATDAEAAATLPGDELIPQARWGYTHAITIDASPEQVWPWIAQLGQGRGGFYSYEGLENLIGCHVHNVDTLVSEYQNIVVGEQIRLHPQAPPLTVSAVEPNFRLVLHGDLPETGDAQIWAFHLHPVDHRRTRLIERGRGTFGPPLSSRLAFSPTLIEPVSFVMSRKMLLTIRHLAESRTRPITR
ncbi:hypothetical protein ACVH9Z_32870 [Rhodococcus opacus]|uniref:hypothetical protein n=1 Tax=Rhodococcus opacus TaxID=37919 RepID=UPI001FEFB9D8|nr:hypothetical protein [Rhodococcus opacus]